MIRIFDLLLMLYPASYRAEFGREMRAVFWALAKSRKSERGLSVGWFAWKEFFGLLRGATYERCHRVMQRGIVYWPTATSMITGTLCAFGMHLLMYWALVPGKSKRVSEVLETLASRVFLLCLVVGLASGQQQAKQDSNTLELAKSIYSRSFTALREAKTLQDMQELADHLDSPDWIGVDRFGRTVLTRRDADREMKSVLSLPPERRITGMDIIWAERDSEQLIVVAWMMPNEVEVIDSEGEYGQKGTTHRLLRGTLVRDIFLSTDDGWRRIRHDKLLPNSTILAVDGAPQIVPPLNERNRVAPPSK